MSSLSCHERIRRLQRLPWRVAARLGGVRGPFDTPQAQALAAELRAAFAVYRTDRLVGIAPATFEADLRAREGVVDAAVEGYDTAALERQRDLSIRFTWGHTHDFGSFAVQGEMRERHLELMANFLSIFDLPRTHVRDRDVLDVGCWTGGTTLRLAALGARVVAIEEVRKYAATAHFLVARRLGSRLRPRPQDGPDADLPRRVVGARYPVVRDPNRARGVRPSRSGSSTAFRSGAPSTQDSARCSPPFPCC